MRRILVIAAAILWPAQIFAQASVPLQQKDHIAIANASATGTTLNKLAKLTGAPSTAVLTATTDTAGSVGVVVAGAGTTGSATIQIYGPVSCVFDGATTAGHYVQISSTTAGDCHDTGSTYPTSGQVLGRVLSTNGGAGTYQIELFPAEIVASSGTTSDVTSSAHGLAPISPADATKFLNGAATPAYAQVKDSDLSLSNVTTNDSTSSQHGFLQKLSGNGSDCHHGDGTWGSCSSGGGGSGTSPFYYGPTLTALDSVSNWSTVNSDATTSTVRLNTNAAEQIKFRANPTLNWRLRVENLPAAPYTITATLTCSEYLENNADTCGIYLYDGTKLTGIELLVLAAGSGAVHEYRVERMTNVNTDSATVVTVVTTGSPVGRVLVFRIQDDNAGTRTWAYSEDDGNTFTTYATESSTAFLTPTKWGYGGVQQTTAGNSAIIRLVSMKVTSP